jgi:hypothetical protein
MDIFDSVFDPCVDDGHMLEFHKVDEMTGTIYDFCLKCEYMIPRQVAE